MTSWQQPRKPQGETVDIEMTCGMCGVKFNRKALVSTLDKNGNYRRTAFCSECRQERKKYAHKVGRSVASIKAEMTPESVGCRTLTKEEIAEVARLYKPPIPKKQRQPDRVFYDKLENINI